VFVTGGLASGKKTVCEYLHSKGATYLDLDAIAKEVSSEPQITRQIQEAFGWDIVDAEGEIKSSLLAERAFATPESSNRLNSIVWPAVKERLADLLISQSCQLMHTGDLVVVEIPMLTEAPDFPELADVIITVSLPEKLRLQRAVERGMSYQDASNRLALQATDEQREAISSVVFENSGSLENLYSQVDNWYNSITVESLF
jgi:dephospho-CoA kinase